MTQTPPRRPLTRRFILGVSLSFGLAACGNTPLGSQIDEGGFGNPTANNLLYQTGQLTYSEELGRRFAEEVPTTINFAFNSAALDGAARAILREQAAFIRHFPEVRFTIYGHTDLVGSREYNHRLGLRRANSALDYLVSQGIDRHRLQALVSLGETQPVIATDTQERRNRRTVTEVSGFVESHPLVLDGRYALITQRAYNGGGGEGDG